MDIFTCPYFFRPTRTAQNLSNSLPGIFFLQVQIYRCSRNSSGIGIPTLFKSVVDRYKLFGVYSFQFTIIFCFYIFGFLNGLSVFGFLFLPLFFRHIFWQYNFSNQDICFFEVLLIFAPINTIEAYCIRKNLRHISTTTVRLICFFHFSESSHYPNITTICFIENTSSVCCQ